MKCGHCKAEGVDVEHVRICAGADPTPAVRITAENLAQLPEIIANGAVVTKVIEDGYYTVVFDETRDDRITLRVRPHWEEGPARRGEKVADYLRGSENTRDYQGFAFITPQGELRIWKRFAHNERLRDAWNVIIRDPDEAGMAYALRSGNCRRCGHTLTVPASIHRGMGPVCAAGGRD